MGHRVSLPYLSAGGRSCHPRLSDGGAFQISLSRMQIDFYPYHLAVGDRSAWIRYQVRRGGALILA